MFLQLCATFWLCCTCPSGAVRRLRVVFLSVVFYACLPSTCIRQRIVTHTPCWSGQSQAWAPRFIAFRLTNQQQPLVTLSTSLLPLLLLLSLTLALCLCLSLSPSCFALFQNEIRATRVKCDVCLPQPQSQPQLGAATIWQNTHTYTWICICVCLCVLYVLVLFVLLCVCSF